MRVTVSGWKESRPYFSSDAFSWRITPHEKICCYLCAYAGGRRLSICRWCVRENTAGQMFVFAPDTSCLLRWKKQEVCPGGDQGRATPPPHSHSAQAKRPKLIVEKEARSREQIGHSTFLSSALASVQLGTYIYICAFSWAAASRHPTHNGPGAVYKSDSPACEIKVRARRENAAVGVSWVQCRCISNEPCACGERRFTLYCYIERAAPITPVYTTDCCEWETVSKQGMQPALHLQRACCIT